MGTVAWEEATGGGSLGKGDQTGRGHVAVSRPGKRTVRGSTVAHAEIVVAVALCFRQLWAEAVSDPVEPGHRAVKAYYCQKRAESE